MIHLSIYLAQEVLAESFVIQSAAIYKTLTVTSLLSSSY